MAIIVGLSFEPMMPVPVKSKEDDPVIVMVKSEAVAVNKKLYAVNSVPLPGT